MTRVDEYFFAYLCYLELFKLERRMNKSNKDKYGTSDFGFALRFGKFSVISVFIRKYYTNSVSFNDISKKVLNILNKWQRFENNVRKLKSNKFYFYRYQNTVSKEWITIYNYDGYYKGRTINKDLLKYFDN